MIKFDKIFESGNHVFYVYNSFIDDLYTIVPTVEKFSYPTKAYEDCINMYGSVAKIYNNEYDILFKYKNKIVLKINDEFKIYDDVDTVNWEISFTGLNFCLLDEI